MKNRLANRAAALGESITQAITNRSRELVAQGVEVINLGIGQPDFPTPDPVADAGKKAIDENDTGYTAAGGTNELKDAVINRFALDSGVVYSRDEVIASTGARQVLFNLFQVILNPGDEVVVPVPCWVAYLNQIRFAAGTPVPWPFDPEKPFRPDFKHLPQLLSKKTRAVLINTPTNPTGVVWTRDELLTLCRICLGSGILLVVDEVYSRFIFDNAIHHFPPAFSQAVKENCVVVNAVSKNYAMTGWRLGYGAGPAHIMSAMLKAQSLNTGCPSSISQRAAIHALNGPQACCFEMASRFQARKEVIVQALEQIPNIRFAVPRGAFYVFCDFSAYLPGKYRAKRLETATDLCLLFLEQAHVASFPGEAFGTGEHIRFSFAVSRKKIETALNKIMSVLSQISDHGPTWSA